jgi:V8-like Glu-specific endopeptidase
MRTCRVLVAIAIAIAISSTFNKSLNAQNRVLVNRLGAAAETAQYWTPEKMASAQPLYPTVSFNPATSDVNASGVSGTPVQAQGWAPDLAAPMTPTRFYDPNDVKIESEPDFTDLDVEPSMFGTLGARFSSTRLVPTTADTVYPHRVIGKLFFTTNTGINAVCSASIIQRRIIATAGHCVHNGNGSTSGWYSNFRFVPALRNGVGPWGSYTWAAAIVTGTWFSGGGGVPNAADYAMIELNDKSGVRIGSLLGWLGWITLSLSGNHANLMGYPCNLDLCNLMHQVTAEAFSNAANNTVIYGSDMRGGSSGGPWVQNFGAASSCSSGCSGFQTGRNQIIGVTSYGPVSTTPLYQGASILDSRWVSIFNSICARRAGNCS